jgi:two-component system response regulator YesN
MASFYELLLKLEALEESYRDGHIPKKIELAMEHMQKHFSDPLLSVSSIAETLDISTAYLRREFSRVYRKSPIAFLKDLRIETAKNLLQFEYLSVSEIAQQTGFSSSSYFVQTFHNTVGISPLRYRQSVLTEDLTVDKK